jgi:indolepyruvate ferredoxin oxidoreductase alpha subunit
VLEPADPAEVSRFYLEAARQSQTHRMPVILRLTTHVCHAKERVSFGAWNPVQPDDTPKFDPANGPYIPLTTLAIEQKRASLEKLEQVRQRAEETNLNRFVDNGNRSRGVITMGLPFLSLMDALNGAAAKPDIMKLAYVHPLPRKKIVRFLSSHQEIKILEELDDVVENQIKAMAFDLRLPVKILGKTQPEDWIGEYTPDKVRQVLSTTWPEMVKPAPMLQRENPAPHRPPQMCPGCGHRSAFHAIQQALAPTDITVADIGCHTLGFLPPYEMGQLLMCMGASTAIASGLRLFNTSRKVVAFMGDSTLFHAALPGIVNAIFNRHPVTLIIMENGTTAMTGHQDNPTSGKNVNEVTDKIPIRQVLEGLGIRHITEVDAYQQAKLAELVIEAVSIDEFSVVIARHPCMLKFTREQKKNRTYQQQHVSIDQQVCERIHTCIETFGCPTFTRDPEGNVSINADLCIGDGSCIQTCPTKAILPAGKPRKGGAA